MFIGTLKAPYYEKLVGNAMKNFADMVILGEMIDNTIKSGKISMGESSGSIKKPISTEIKKELNAVNYNTVKFPQNPCSAQGVYALNILYPSFSPYQMTPVVHSAGITPTVTLTPNPVQNTPPSMQSRSTTNARALSNHQAH